MARSANDVLSPQLRRVATVVVLGSIMSILDTTIVAVALDTLGKDFHVTVSTIQWVTTGYLLALAVVIPVTGWAVDRFGAKRVWMLSLTLFIVGSSLCGLAWSANSPSRSGCCRASVAACSCPPGRPSSPGRPGRIRWAGS